MWLHFWEASSFASLLSLSHWYKSSVRYGGGDHYTRGRWSSHGSAVKPITRPIRVLTDLQAWVPGLVGTLLAPVPLAGKTSNSASTVAFQEATCRSVLKDRCIIRGKIWEGSSQSSDRLLTTKSLLNTSIRELKYIKCQKHLMWAETCRLSFRFIE